jgi:hypothetical protein
MHGAGRWLWTRVVRPAALAIGDALWPQTCLITGEWLPGAAGSLSPAARAIFDAQCAIPACPRCARNALSVTLDEAGCGVCRASGSGT